MIGQRAQPHRAVVLRVNGQEWSGTVSVGETLLETLRGRLRLTGTKRSCEEEVCGACTVLVDGQAVSSCTFLTVEAAGRAVLTIEGLAEGDKLHPIQEAFVRQSALQCGFCTPGMIMTAKALLEEYPAPDRETIRWYLNGSICRCGSYPAIEAAILEAAERARRL
jgi:aerobic-type carbon monoxide dehydrogenase small subunit (CoxS/CutS family)